MPNLVRPFRVIQPPRHLAHLVASRSYISYERLELKDKLTRNPYSYLQVINPDTDKELDADRGSKEYFREIRTVYDEFLKNGWLVGGDDACYIIYRQTSPTHSFTGIVALLDLPKCEEGALLTHELTLERRENLFSDYLECVGFHAEPILCARPSNHPGEAVLDRCISEVVNSREADCDFSTTDYIRHSIWHVNPELNPALTEALGPLNKLYLADGHHRLASSIKLRHRHPNEPGVDRILAMILPAKEMSILGYHRQIKTFAGNLEELIVKINRLESVRKVEEISKEESRIQKLGCIDLLNDGKSFRIFIEEDESGLRTDAGWLSENILQNLLEISDPRNDPKLKYIPGSSDAALTESSKEKIIFALHPTPIDQIIAVSDAGKTLPPKSTWVEPKLRSGLFIYEFGMHPHPTKQQ
jgi:uncharacterized protein (DUF1015 family)|tara:strand:+ start:1324 stop:2568 length:1245 start_codon:yes stop_codon:yes gene_type:complete